jgi:hypothetical protein
MDRLLGQNLEEILFKMLFMGVTHVIKYKLKDEQAERELKFFFNPSMQVLFQLK